MTLPGNCGMSNRRGLGEGAELRPVGELHAGLADDGDSESEDACTDGSGSGSGVPSPGKGEAPPQAEANGFGPGEGIFLEADLGVAHEASGPFSPPG